MSYLGYKNPAFRKRMREKRKSEELKTKQRDRRRRIREWCHISTIAILQLVIVALIIVFYGLFAIGVMAKDTTKVGDGPFVLAVSYTESYKDLQYVANFNDCDTAMTYFHSKCSKATIAMCQREDAMHMKINNDVKNTSSTFDFKVGDSQSCGFVKTQAGYSTFVEEN